MRVLPIKPYLLAFLCLSFAVLGGTAFAGLAKDRALAKLQEHGYDIGYVSSRGLFFAIGEAEFERGNPADIVELAEHRQFLQTREYLSKRAYLEAKVKLMQSLSLKVSGLDRHESSIEAADGMVDKGEARSTSLFTAFANEKLLGARIANATEAYDPQSKAYSVAIVVCWGPKMVSPGERFRNAVLDVDYGDVSSTPWREWAAKKDLASIIGCRQFYDTAGNLYLAAVGCAAAEGLKGPQLDVARANAERSARKNLMFEVFCNQEARTVTKQKMRESVSGSHEEVSVKSELYSSIITRCDDLQERLQGIRPGKIAFSGIVRHPLTGGRMCVAICGIGPFVTGQTATSKMNGVDGNDGHQNSGKLKLLEKDVEPSGMGGAPEERVRLKDLRSGRCDGVSPIFKILGE